MKTRVQAEAFISELNALCFKHGFSIYADDTITLDSENEFQQSLDTYKDDSSQWSFSSDTSKTHGGIIP